MPFSIPCVREGSGDFASARWDRHGVKRLMRTWPKPEFKVPIP
jgi:hypothetical protein